MKRVPSQSSPAEAQGVATSDPSWKWLLLSEAQYLLEQGMWGGLHPFPREVAEAAPLPMLSATRPSAPTGAATPWKSGASS